MNHPMRKFIYLLVGMVFPVFAWALPDGFVYVDEVSNQTIVDLRYLKSNNFLNRPVAGYFVNRAILTRPAAEALSKVEDELRIYGLGVLIFDAYRPQRAVNDFVKWAKDLKDVKAKANYYPNVDKSNLFKEGYIAEQSGHSRGSTVDLTLISLAKNKPLNMGTDFDYFGPESWPYYPNVPPQQRANRLLLQLIMTKYGFKPYPQEWWHFTLENEPYPNTYFDFEVK
jgi:D-alanyl-D-alanine dipeptidase